MLRVRAAWGTTPQTFRQCRKMHCESRWLKQLPWRVPRQSAWLPGLWHRSRSDPPIRRAIHSSICRDLKQVGTVVIANLELHEQDEDNRDDRDSHSRKQGIEPSQDLYNHLLRHRANARCPARTPVQTFDLV